MSDEPEETLPLHTRLLAIVRSERAEMQQQQREDQERIILERMDEMRRAVKTGMKARDIEVEIVHDPAAADDFFYRHMRLNEAQWTAQTILQSEQQPHLVKALNERLKRGAFFGGEREGYTLEGMRQYILSPERIMARAKGKVFNTEKLTFEQTDYVSDVHIHLAPDREGAPLISYVPLPTDRERFYTHRQKDAIEVAKRVHDDPAILACIEDVSTYPEMQNKGFANALERRVFEYIRTVINAQRKHAIGVLVANMFSVKGARTKEKEVMLPSPIQNEVSIYLHGFRNDPNHMMAWTSPDTEIEVDLPSTVDAQPETATLILGWETAAIKLS